MVIRGLFFLLIVGEGGAIPPPAVIGNAVNDALRPLGAVIAQIVAIDIVFSVDSILTAVGMTDQIPIMVTAVVITVGIMMVAADPLARFIEKNPTLVMLALAFLVMIGLVLIADGFGFHVPKGYIYAAMGFSIGVELLNMTQRKRRETEPAGAEENG